MFGILVLREGYYCLRVGYEYSSDNPEPSRNLFCFHAQADKSIIHITRFLVDQQLKESKHDVALATADDMSHDEPFNRDVKYPLYVRVSLSAVGSTPQPGWTVLRKVLDDPLLYQFPDTPENTRTLKLCSSSLRQLFGKEPDNIFFRVTGVYLATIVEYADSLRDNVEPELASRFNNALNMPGYVAFGPGDTYIS